jgi:asparagine synthase (glutamine-hydrolysing)
VGANDFKLGGVTRIVCGIAAIFGKSKAWEQTGTYLEVVERAIDHRGPDGRGHHAGRDWGFANVRLAIVDVAGGAQPIFSDDGAVGIVYNGEVYNHAGIRRELEQQGCRFRTQSDTEVILRAYEVYGPDAFDRFNGMFAFCIWDGRKGEGYVVRDHIGIKPLYIYEDSEKIICCSELKGIAAIPDVALELDPVGIQDYLLFRYVQAPYTLFRNVRCLEAGTYLRVRGGVCSQYRYWDLSYRESFPPPGLEETKHELRSRLQSAVQQQLMGEVPIGVLLSGGIDSSAIAYYVRQAGADLTTFNIGFPEVNEFEYSRAVAASLGLRHVEVVTTVEELNTLFEQVVLALDHPIADPACLPLFRLAEELKHHVTVVLSGEGGDELFGGYPQYSHMMQSAVAYQERFRRFLERSWYFLDYAEFLQEPVPRSVEFRYWKYFDELPLLNGMLAYDMKTWMPENLMMKADKILMAHSLEGRFPFLDAELVAFAASLPTEYKLARGKVNKWILKEALHDLIPKNIIGRPKMGFTVPVEGLLKNMREMVLDTIDDARTSSIARIVKMEHVTALANRFYRGHTAQALRLWSVFVLLHWLRFALPSYKMRTRMPGRGLRDAA